MSYILVYLVEIITWYFLLFSLSKGINDSSLMAKDLLTMKAYQVKFYKKSIKQKNMWHLIKITKQ